MKLSKQQIKQHEAAVVLLGKEQMTYEDKCNVYENWYPAYGNQIGKIASFFTPFGLARDFKLEIYPGNRIVDLCAGIGLLSFYHYHAVKMWDRVELEVVCVEQNPAFVEVGKKLFPEATWICGDVTDRALIESLGVFDVAISNPPFGKISTGSDTKCWLSYTGAEFDLKVVEIGSKLAKYGAYILPQMSCPFKYSGNTRRGFEYSAATKYEKFHEQTGIILNPNCGIDCDFHKEDWKGAAPTVEIVTVDPDEPYEYRKPTTQKVIEQAPVSKNEAADMLASTGSIQEVTIQQILF